MTTDPAPASPVAATRPYGPDEPAMFVTTYTTLPILTTALFAFSVAVLGIAANPGWPTTLLPVVGIGTKEAAFPLLGTSALLFLLSTQACVKSHAWDYYAIPAERLPSEQLPSDSGYIDDCLRESRRWHERAAWTYRWALAISCIALAVLFLPASGWITVMMAAFGLVNAAGNLQLHYRFWRARRLEAQTSQSPK